MPIPKSYFRNYIAPSSKKVFQKKISSSGFSPFISVECQATRSPNHHKKTSVNFKAAKRSLVYFGFDLGDRAGQEPEGVAIVRENRSYILITQEEWESLIETAELMQLPNLLNQVATDAPAQLVSQ